MLTGEQSALTGSGTNSYNDVYTDVFGYDAAYNPTQFSLYGTPSALASPPYNADNQDRRSAFDGDGNPTTYVSALASGRFTFDPEDRLTGITGRRDDG